MQMRNLIFSAAVTCIARGAVLRDHALGRVRAMRRQAREGRHAVSRHAIMSGG